MAQGEFTKEECKLVRECVDELWKAIPKSKKRELLGELNDIHLFISVAEKVAPFEGLSERKQT